MDQKDMNDLRKKMDEADATRKKTQKEREESEKVARHEEFVTEAFFYEISAKQLEFLEKHFALKNHEHWDGRIG